MSVHVSVAIVGFRNPVDIAGCLTALEASTHDDFEVVICENGGPGAHAELLGAIPQALPGGQPVRVLLASGNLGFAGGVNLCMAHSSQADAWWVLNPDTEPRPDAMSRMVDRLMEGDCEAVGSCLSLPNGRLQSFGGRWRPWLARAESIGNGLPLDHPVDVLGIERQQNYINGASMLIDRRFLSVVGPMREDYFLYCEEVEWCLRGLAKGMRLGFAPRATVLHNQGSTTGSGADLRNRSRLSIYLSERNKILLTRDCYVDRLPIAAAAALLMTVARYPRRGAWRQWGYALKGWWAGIRNERGPPVWTGR